MLQNRLVRFQAVCLDVRRFLRFQRIRNTFTNQPTELMILFHNYSTQWFAQHLEIYYVDQRPPQSEICEAPPFTAFSKSFAPQTQQKNLNRRPYQWPHLVLRAAILFLFRQYKKEYVADFLLISERTSLRWSSKAKGPANRIFRCKASEIRKTFEMGIIRSHIAETARSWQ